MQFKIILPVLVELYCIFYTQSLSMRRFRWNKRSEFDDFTTVDNLLCSINDVTTALQCGRKCTSNVKCLSFTYNKQDRVCHLHSQKRGGNTSYVLSVESRHYIIEQGDCPTDDAFVLLRDVGVCFKTFSLRKSWHAAGNHCRTLQSRLIVLDSEDKNNAVSDYIDKYIGGLHYYIGLTDEMKEGEFVWENGNVATTVFWLPLEPNDSMNSEDCTELYPSYRSWSDKNCSREREYICERPI